MIRKFARAFLPAFVITALSLVGIELLLQAADPIGVRYLYNVVDAKATFLLDSSGYAMPPGPVQLRGWSYTIDAAGTRDVPAAVQGGARVQFFGDSVTFGQSVNDAETWVSLVSQRLMLDAVNAGRMGYGARNIAELMATQPDGCAVVLTIPNDVDYMTPVTHTAPPAMESYLYYTLMLLQRERSDMVTTLGAEDADYLAAMDAIASRPETLLIAFDDEYGQMVRSRYGAALIPWYANRVSFADAHADALGNRQIADAVTPILRDWLAERECGAGSHSPIAG